MERRFREYGAGLFAVLQTKRQVMMSFGDIQGAREAMDGLSREKEGPLKDCPACDLNDQVKFYFLINDPKEALRRASPILADKMKCATVPQTTLAKVLLPLVFEGRLDDAVEYHRKGYSMIGTNPDFLSDAADHIRFLTVTDNLSQAIKALERHLPNAFAARELFARLHFYESAMFLMERCAEQDPSVKLRVPNEFPLQSDQGKFDAATLARWFYDQAAEIAAQFDARNGNTYRMSELEGVRKLHRKVTPHSIGK